MSIGKQASWAVATAIAAVEVLKDQGVARWNYPLRLLHKNVIARVRTITIPSRSASSPSSSSSSSSSSSADFIRTREKKTVAFEKAMGISCFGPTTVRF